MAQFGNVQVGQILELVESIGVMLASFSGLLLLVRGIDKDATVRLDEARPPPMYIFKKYYEFDKLENLTNLKPTQNFH